MRIKSLFVYPVKSCKGFEVNELQLEQSGPKWDREFMVVDADGKFLSQRECPKLALISVIVRTASVLIVKPWSDLLIPLENHASKPINVEVWGDRVEALDQGDVPSRFFSDFLERSCRLVRYCKPRMRYSDFFSGSVQVSFADAYPLLIISQGSLDDLNRRLSRHISMDRFRPNIVVEGVKPYAEDDCGSLQINGVSLRGGPLCVRCVITTTDQDTAITGKEPLATLAKYRKREKGVVFGRNFAHLTIGSIRKGDVVSLLEKKN